MAEKPTVQDKYALGGMAVGIAIAAVLAIMFASESGTIVRYLIMASGLVLGWLAGRALGQRAGDGPP